MRATEVFASVTATSPLPTPRMGRRLLEHVRIPLQRDGYALAVNSASTAVTGLMYGRDLAKRWGGGRS
jgi:hypothetical protein